VITYDTLITDEPGWNQNQVCITANLPAIKLLLLTI